VRFISIVIDTCHGLLEFHQSARENKEANDIEIMKDSDLNRLNGVSSFPEVTLIDSRSQV